MTKEKPFVINAEGYDRKGNLFEVPLGVEFGICIEDAWVRATRRWPYFTISDPLSWDDNIPVEIRLEALRADRGEPLLQIVF